VEIPLLDDGNGPDRAAGDGLYTSVWVPQHTGGYTLIFPNDEMGVRVFPAYSYSFVPFSWETIGGTNLNLSDDSFTGIRLPFRITLGELSFPSLYVDSNGKLNFPFILESDWINKTLPVDGDVNYQYMVAPFWDDLLPIQNTAQNVFWDTTGTAPNRKLVVEWRNVSRASGCQDPAATITFQVVFQEGSSDILFNYANSVFGGPPACAEGDHGAHATVGLELINPSAVQVSFDQPSIQDQMSIRFTLVKPPFN
jgi:hypothetical protein